MLKRIAMVGGLALLGLMAGYASTYLGGPRYHIGTVLWLPRHSAHSPAELVAMTSGRHPGAQVRASGGNKISIEATGSIEGAEHAVREAYGAVVAANDGQFQFLPYYAHFADPVGLAGGEPLHRGMDGMLAGIGAALGFLFPPRSRVGRCPQRGAGMPMTPAMVGGIAVVSVILTLAAIVVALLALRYHPAFTTITGAL